VQVQSKSRGKRKRDSKISNRRIPEDKSPAAQSRRQGGKRKKKKTRLRRGHSEAQESLSRKSRGLGQRRGCNAVGDAKFQDKHEFLLIVRGPQSRKSSRSG